MLTNDLQVQMQKVGGGRESEEERERESDRGKTLSCPAAHVEIGKACQAWQRNFSAQTRFPALSCHPVTGKLSGVPDLLSKHVSITEVEAFSLRIFSLAFCFSRQLLQRPPFLASLQTGRVDDLTCIASLVVGGDCQAGRRPQVNEREEQRWKLLEPSGGR